MADVPEPPWWRTRDESDRSERRPLTRKAIVDAALVLLDRDGLTGLSMRKLAQELGAGADIAPPPLDAEALALEQRYVAAGTQPPADADLTSNERAALFALREAGRVVLLQRGIHVHVSFAQ